VSESAKEDRLGKLRLCLQCAVCTGSCPVARVIDGYNPREIILRCLLYGEDKAVTDADTVWSCLTCHTCEERCPHGISVGDLLIEIMNRAAAEGRLPAAIRQTIANIARTGRAVPVSARCERLRKNLGLEPLRACDTDAVQELFRKCGVDKMLEPKCE